MSIGLAAYQKPLSLGLSGSGVTCVVQDIITRYRIYATTRFNLMLPATLFPLLRTSSYTGNYFMNICI